MKSSLKQKTFVRSQKILAVLLVACAVGALRGELTEWAANTEAGSKIEAALFRMVAMPWGSISTRRPPKETKPELTKLIDASPKDGELYALRALEEEQQLDFKSAEEDWRKRIELVKDREAARVALADFYHRRAKPMDEFNALAMAAMEYGPDSDKLLPDNQTHPWKFYERLMPMIDDYKLDPQISVQHWWNWVNRYPKNEPLYRKFFDFMMAHAELAVADSIVQRYQAAFPQAEEFPIEARAEMFAKSGTPTQALAVYERAFKPLWPESLVKDYFAMLKKTNSLRAYLNRARAGVASNPTEVANAARLFYYWQQQNNLPAAERALIEYRQRKDSRNSAWTTDDLLTMARLFELAHDYDEAARNYYAMYSSAGSNDAQAEIALASLARMILTAPEQQIHFGSGNLSLYRDVATMDPHPGFLNGVLSLLLNNTDPPNRAAMEEQNAAPYFRRERGAELAALFESRFPKSAERADLRERVIEAYAIYGSNDGVIRAGTKFLTDFPDVANRTSVALRVADAYARTNQTRQEFAIYDSLLAELAKRADNVPIGSFTPSSYTPPSSAGALNTVSNGSGQAAQAVTAQPGVRSPEYSRVLDRYIARLVSLKRVRDALAIYRREIDRNPNDPGLYDVLAAFLEQNKLGAEMETTYQRAIAQFPDHTWEHKLARWYLRQRRQADVSKLTQDVIRIFSGTELDAYFKEIVRPAQPVGPALYLQLNLYAHKRFPHHLSFVRNLLSAYSAGATRNDLEYLALLREHWLDADDLRMRFFERLSRTRTLATELAALRNANPAILKNPGQAEDQNPAAVRMLAEGETWRCHFEAAAPMFKAIQNDFPADAAVGSRTMAIDRSLGTIDPKTTDSAIVAGAKLNEALPRDVTTLTRLGEMEADRERFDKAAAYWNRIPAIEPGKADRYVETAAIYWDYYRYDDALRVIEDARKKLAQPNLFAYESGAILENMREYNRAVREYARGAIDQSGSAAEKRLIALARRPELRAEVEQLTSNLVITRDPPAGMYQLRVALLRNQGRRNDLEAFLTALAGRTTSADLLTLVENDARLDAMPKAQEAAIEREIAIATDPVEKTRLRLALARFYEGHNDPSKGAQTIDAVYRENPAILGVVRATVDYYWRNKNSKRAIDVLEESAGRAAAGYRADFTLEAARKSVDSGDYARARAFTARLLTDAPYRAEYIAVMADAFARAGDDRGLRAFYDAKIRELQSAQIPQTQRTEQIASMRRALIPVLTRTKDYAGALDQYIEVLNRFPEDDSLAREAAQYASANGIASRLRDYYTKAATDSPKDFRWPMVLARIDTQLEDFPAAITAYSKAAEVRPDRADLFSSRLNLEERLLRFDEAGATAQKLYELTYRNPEWMVKFAEIRARQGRIADAVAALEKAWIEGRSPNPKSQFDIAQKLENWGALAEARKFAEQGMKGVTDENRDDLRSGVELYARVLARLRAYNAASPQVISAASAQMAMVAGDYFSPEEKSKYAAWVAAHPRIDLVRGAGMADVEAKMRVQALMAAAVGPRAAANLSALLQLQKSRFAFDELGAQLEAYNAVLPPNAPGKRDLTEAAEVYRASGNAAAEFRVMELANNRAALGGPLLDRYAQLVLAQPQRLTTALGANANDTVQDGVLNYAMEHSTPAIVQQAIDVRGKRAGPLWTNAYTALAGLYFATNATPVRNAYATILGDMTIGSRIGKPVDRTQQLAGDEWFYYGGRFGEYLGDRKLPGSDDFLPAMIEGQPQQSQSYFDLAEYFKGSGNAAAAAIDYRNALDLNSRRADAHDRLAQIAASAGRREDALAEWKLAITALMDTLDRSAAPPKFWVDASDVLRHIGEAKLLGPLRDDLDKLLRAYVHRNGTYQVDPLLEGMMAAAGDVNAGVEWMVDVSRVAPEPARFLADVVNKPWLPEAQRNTIYRRIVEAAQAKVAASFGEERNYAQNDLSMWQIEWAKYLVSHGEPQQAQQVVEALPQDRHNSPDVIEIRVRAAAQTGRLTALLASFDESIQSSTLREAADQLTKQGDAASSRRVMEFVFNRELKAGKFDASNFLGLAEIRLAENDTPGAVALLKRAELISGAAFSSLDASAALLEKTGHANEAIPFLADLSKAEPWNFGAKGRLAAAQNAADALTAVAKSSDALYSSRVAAAITIRKMKAPALTGTDAELALLSSQLALTEAEVSKPYFVAARIEAARESGDAASRVKWLSGAIAIDPRLDAQKMELFHAAIEVRRDSFAIAIGKQMIPSYMVNEGEFQAWQADQFMANLPMADRVTIARGLAAAYQRSGDLRTALLFDLITDHLQPANQTRQSIATIRAQIDLNTKNNARRPMVSKNLDQDRLVHARLTR